MARVGALVRVSSLKVSQDESPERQKERATEWAQRNGHELTEMIEERITGSKSVGHRPGLDALMALARRRAVRGVWVARLDRLGRDALGIHLVVRELESLGCHVFIEDVFGGSPYDSKNPASHYMLTMLAGAAQLAKDMLGKAAVEGKERARLKGIWVTRPKEDIPENQARWLLRWWFEHPGDTWYRATKEATKAGHLQPGRFVKRTGTQRPARPWSWQQLKRAFERWKLEQKGIDHGKAEGEGEGEHGQGSDAPGNAERARGVDDGDRRSQGDAADQGAESGRDSGDSCTGGKVGHAN